MFRCAKGYISFPPAFQRLEKAETLLRKGLEISSDSGYGNHVMAQYYERVKKVSELQSISIFEILRKNIFQNFCILSAT